MITAFISILLMFVVGVGFGMAVSENRSRMPKAKRLEEFTDDELFSLYLAVINETSKRGAAMMDVFEELEGDEKK